MAVKDVFKVTRKTFLNPSGWLGYSEVKATTVTLYSLVKNLFVSAEPQRVETFEEALIRLNLTEADIKETAQNYYLYAFVFLTLAICMAVFGLYLLFFHGLLLDFLLAVGVTALLLGQSFRYHFWFFQIQQRKLGCTFAEWRHSTLPWLGN